MTEIKPKRICEMTIHELYDILRPEKGEWEYTVYTLDEFNFPSFSLKEVKVEKDTEEE